MKLLDKYSKKMADHGIRASGHDATIFQKLKAKSHPRLNNTNHHQKVKRSFPFCIFIFIKKKRMIINGKYKSRRLF